jgi:hypothetical protein
LDFGVEIPDNSSLVRVLRNSKKMDPVSSRIVLQQAYEDTFGIFNYISQIKQEQTITDPGLKRPLSSVAMHPAEDTSAGSRIRELIKIYARLKVYQNYGLSFTELLELPVEYVDDILMECSKIYKEEEKRAVALTDTLNQSVQKKQA